MTAAPLDACNKKATEALSGLSHSQDIHPVGPNAHEATDTAGSEIQIPRESILELYRVIDLLKLPAVHSSTKGFNPLPLLSDAHNNLSKTPE